MTQKHIIIIGASGHGKVIADIIKQNGDSVVGYLDDETSLGKEFNSYPILGIISDYSKYMNYYYIIAIGDAVVRKRIVDKFSNVRWYTAIHPKAIVANDVSVGEGTVIMANAVINPGALIGSHCIINTAAVVEHDNIIEDFVHISVGVKLAGTVHVGELSWIGIGTIVSNNITICSKCMIGAGSVVVKDIRESGTYVGVPSHRIK